MSPEPRMKRQVVTGNGDSSFQMLDSENNLSQVQPKTLKGFPLSSRPSDANLLFNNDYQNFIMGDEDIKALRNITPKSLKDLNQQPPEIVIDTLPTITVEDQIINNYKNELLMIGPAKAHLHSELLTVLYSAYNSLI